MRKSWIYLSSLNNKDIGSSFCNGRSVDHAAVEGSGVIDGASGVLGDRGKAEKTVDLDWRDGVTTTFSFRPSRVVPHVSLPAVTVLFEASCALVHALLGASICEAFLFLLFQIFGDHSAEVLVVSPSELEVGFFVSIG